MKLALVILGLTLSTGLASVALADGSPTDDFVAAMTDTVATQQGQAQQLAQVTQDNAGIIADSVAGDVGLVGPFLAMLQGGAPDPAALTQDPAGAIGAFPGEAQGHVDAAQQHASACFAAYAAAADAFAQEQGGVDISPLIGSAIAQCHGAQAYATDPAGAAQALVATFALPSLPQL